MKENIDICEGYSLNYLVHSVFLIITGGLFLLYQPILSPLFFLLGIALLFSKTGVYFAFSKNSVIVYKTVFGYKLGENYNLDSFNHSVLKYSHDATLMNSRGSSNVIRAKTYDIHLSLDNGEDILLHDFTDYKLAKNTFHVFRDILNYQGYNQLG